MIARRLDSLQVLRGIAATAVVAHHALRAAAMDAHRAAAPVPPLLSPTGPLVEMGAMGVDVFFVLSGFLMMAIAGPYFRGKRSVGHFLVQRLIRIWPLYALVTALVCAAALATTGASAFDLRPHRLASFVFVPSFDRFGHMLPILPVGWTLNYEMLFYLCFAVVLASGARFAAAKLVGLLALLFAAGRLAGDPLAHAFLGNPIVFEFAAGAVLGTLIGGGRFVPSRGGLWIAGALALMAAQIAWPTATPPRLLAYGVPAALLFLGLHALEGRVAFPRWLRATGDASYAIYLVHGPVVYKVSGPVTRALAARWPEIAFLGGAGVALAAGIAAGALCFLAIERPLLRATQRFHNRLAHRADPPPMAAGG